MLLLLLLLRSDDVEDVLDVEPFEGDGGGIICDWWYTEAMAADMACSLPACVGGCDGGLSLVAVVVDVVVVDNKLFMLKADCLDLEDELEDVDELESSSAVVVALSECAASLSLRLSAESGAEELLASVHSLWWLKDEADDEDFLLCLSLESSDCSERDDEEDDDEEDDDDDDLFWRCLPVVETVAGVTVLADFFDAFLGDLALGSLAPEAASTFWSSELVALLSSWPRKLS